MTQWLSAGILNNLTAAIQRRAQVLLFFLVLFIGASTVVLGSISIKRSIEAPFAKNKLSALATESLTTQDAKKDTDGDGLLDNEELNVYGTSPYLADSDSDGVSDGEEISKGTDPNCPTGKTCTTGTNQPASGGGNAISNSLFGQIPSSTATPSIAELRNLLKQAGLPADQVDALSDEQILQAYNEAVAETQSGAPPDSSPANEAPANLTAEQIREELIRSGVPKEQIENVSDEDLMRIYNETIQELRKKETSIYSQP